MNTQKNPGRSGNWKNRFFLIIRLIIFLILAAAVIDLRLKVYSLERRIAPEPEAAATADEKETAPDRELYETTVAAVEDLLEDRNGETAVRRFEKLVSSDPAVSVTAGTGLTFHSAGDLHGALRRKGRRYFDIEGEPHRGTVRVESRSGKSMRAGSGEREARNFVLAEREKIDEIAAEEEEMKRNIERFLKDEATVRLLKSRSLQPTRIVSSDFVLRIGFTDRNDIVIFRLSADAEKGEYRINGKRVRTDESFHDELLESLRKYDPEEELRRMERDLRKRLRLLLADAGFRRYLADRGLTVRGEESSKIYLENTAGESVAAIVCEPESGRVVMETGNDDTPRVLYEKIAALDTEGTVRFLLAGINKGSTDTILLVQADESGISMISIPRDIYRKGYKINRLYSAFGPEALIECVEEISGLSIDHYAVVDMGGFEDIVDSLGSIPVELEREILDPSMFYRTDDGRRVLYFSAGEHEINGSAALALARSRSTTSDFSRAARQQLILDGIRKRVEELSLTEAGKLIDFTATALDYSSTDISALEAVQYFREYRNAESIRRTVLSTDNVFYSTYRGLHQRELELEEASRFTDEELGAWILRPVGEDWSCVSRYVKDWLAGKRTPAEKCLSEKEQSF
ncbi:MAG: LCP family protein [Spirochaetia bacterium]